MKKSFTLAIITFGICVTTVQAQISIFPKAGVSWGKYAVKETMSTKHNQQFTTGLVAGVGVIIPIPASTLFSLQGELYYIQKGKELESVMPGVFDGTLQIKQERTLNYVEIPLLAKASIGNKVVKGFLLAGPSFGFGLNGKYADQLREDNTNIVIDREGSVRFKKKPDNYNGEDIYYHSKGYNRIDIGLQFGGGVGFQIGSSTLFLDARYGLGLNNLVKKHIEMVAITMPEGEIQAGLEVPASDKSRMFALTVGYTVAIGK